MSKEPLNDQEIADRVNSMSFDELEQGHNAYIRREKRQKPLYIVIAATMIIGTVNGLYFSSGGIFLMCFLIGGGALFYLWRIVRR